MSLQERLAHAPKGRGHTCTIGLLMATEMDFADREALEGVLVSHEWDSVAIQKALADEGHTVNLKHLQIHRRSGCTSANCPWPNVGVRTEFSGA